MAKPRKKQEIKKKIVSDISFSIEINKSLKIIILTVIALAAIFLPLYYVYYAHSINNFYCFPVDDSWIHLQFARNLVDYGSFSYFKNEQVTAGSTSPIYTLAAAAGYVFTKDEFWLSFTIGILFFMMAVFFYYKLASFLFVKENWLAIIAALMLAIDKRMDLIAVSGMETTLYVFLLIACFYYYMRRNAAGFAITLGFTLWTRPDAVVFIAAIFIDYVYLLYCRKKFPKSYGERNVFSRNELLKIGAISGIIVAAYFGMNLVISGSLLPNTYGAKLAYYTPEMRSQSGFLRYEVWGYFTESAYILLIVPFAIGVIKVISDAVRSKYNPFIVPVLFIFGLIFAYWYKIPYAHRFGRYLIPIFPFYFLIFLYGSRELFSLFARFLSTKKIANAVNIILIAATIIYFTADYIDHRQLYQANTYHIYIRNVLTGNWIKNNTPEGSIIATHDVGAIAYYSGRKLVDIAGLINPEFTVKIHSPGYSTYVEQQMREKNVTHIAFIKEWFQVTNQAPLFVTGDNNLELFEVYKFDPQRTHVLSIEVNSYVRHASDLIQQKQYQLANNYLSQAYQKDTNSALTLFYLAYSNALLGDNAGAERNLQKSLRLYPDYRDATILLSSMYKAQKRIPEAESMVQNYLKLTPGDTTAAAFLKTLKDTVNLQK